MVALALRVCAKSDGDGKAAVSTLTLSGWGDDNITEMLLEAGADPNHRRSHFQENSNPLIFKGLLRPGCPSFSLFFPFLLVLSCRGIPIQRHIIFRNLLNVKEFYYGIT